MAKSKKTGNLRSIDRAKIATARYISGGGLTPGEYVFDEDPLVEYDEVQLTGSDRKYLTVAMKATNGKWMSVNALLKQDINESNDGLVYINEWVLDAHTIWDLADMLAGHSVVVSNNPREVYSFYRNNEIQQAPVKVGQTYQVEPPAVPASEPARSARSARSGRSARSARSAESGQ